MSGVAKKSAKQKEEMQRICKYGLFLKTLVVVALVVFLGTAAWGITQYVYVTQEKGTINFSGTGKIVVTNTVASISFTFSDIQEDVSQAREMVSMQSNSAYEALRETFRIAERDIRTTSYAVYPEYEYIRPLESEPGKNELVGYRVSHTTAIKIRDLDQVGAIIDTISGLEPTSMSGLSFALDDDEQKRLEKQAAIVAIRDARKQANQISRGSGIRLGKIIAVDVYNDYASPKYGYQSNMLLRATADEASAPTPIAEGESHITKTATVTYTIRKQ